MDCQILGVLVFNVYKKVGLTTKDDCVEGLLHLDRKELSSINQFVVNILEKI